VALRVHLEERRLARLTWAVDDHHPKRSHELVEAGRGPAWDQSFHRFVQSEIVISSQE
jgi:hypothetical protein